MLLISQLLGLRRTSLFDSPAFRSSHAPVVFWHLGTTGGLSPVEGTALVDDLAALGSPALIVEAEGGPLRQDLLPLLSRARRQGLATVLATAVPPALAEPGERLAAAGVSLVLVGAESPDAGPYLAACRSAAISTGIRQDLTTPQALARAFSLAEEHRADLCLLHHTEQTAGTSHSRVRDLMDEIYRRARTSAVDVITDGNRADGVYMYLRLRQEDPARSEALRDALFGHERPSFRIEVAHVAPDGSVSPDERWLWGSVGNVRTKRFSEIWLDPEHPLLRGLRHRRLLVQGRCQVCGFLPVCDGNLRGRAGAAYDDPWAEDPGCYLTDDEIHLKHE